MPSFVVASIIAAIIALYPRPRTSELLCWVPYDDPIRAEGPGGIGYPTQQIASHNKEQDLNLKANQENTIY
jgi:hypothetical protein